MKNFNVLIILVVLACLGCSAPKQLRQEILVEAKPLNDRHRLIIGMSNYIDVKVYGSNEKPSSIELEEGRGTVNCKNGTCVVHVKERGLIHLIVEVAGTRHRIPFQAVPIPKQNIIPGLNLTNKNVFSPGAFKAYAGLKAPIVNMDIDAYCKVISFALHRFSEKDGFSQAQNKGGKYEEQARALVMKAEVGDWYIYRDIKCQCPGDETPRTLNELSIEIK